MEKLEKTKAWSIRMPIQIYSTNDFNLISEKIFHKKLSPEMLKTKYKIIGNCVNKVTVEKEFPRANEHIAICN